MSDNHEPESLDTLALRSAVVTGEGLIRRVDAVARTGSTNTDLLTRAASGEDIHGTVLLAEMQDAGRGRHGRKWVTPPGAQVAMSVGVDMSGVDVEKWGWLPLLTGIALVDTLAETCGVRAGLKWPNDILVGPDKLAGILAEVAAPEQTVVLGIGLNVSLDPGDLPTPTTTSLRTLGVPCPDRNRLVADFLHRLSDRIVGWRSLGGDVRELDADYRLRCLTIGTRVRAVLPGDRTLVGDAVGIDRTGRLLIEDGDAVHAVAAGDITHLRPAAGS